ncbi:MAG: A24 family peptidase [Candidatus Micrarchaeota archaeon]
MLFDYISLAVCLFFFALASYHDLKSREVSPYISYGLLIAGLGINAVSSLKLWAIFPILQSAGMALFCFLFAYLLYRIGVWAGGDVKLFTALGAVLPSFLALEFFPIYAFAASFLAVLPFAVIYIAWHIIRNKKLRGMAESQIKKGLVKSFTSSVFFALIYALFGQYSSIEQAAVSAAGVFTATFFIFYGFVCLSVARKHILRSAKSVSKLCEGDIPAKDLVLAGRKKVWQEPLLFDLSKGRKLISSHSAAGLSKRQIADLRKWGFKSIEVKLSMPFVPVLMIGITIVALMAVFI